GACVAGIAFGAIPKYFDSLSEGKLVGYDQFFIGVVALGLVLWAPGGFADIGRRVWRRIEGSGPPPPTVSTFEVDVRDAPSGAAAWPAARSSRSRTWPSTSAASTPSTA